MQPGALGAALGSLLSEVNVSGENGMKLMLTLFKCCRFWVVTDIFSLDI